MPTRNALLSSLILIALVGGCSSAAKAPKLVTREDPLVAKLDSILHQRDGGETVFGARVIDLASGKELYAHDIDRPLMPASNMKLPVSSAGLDCFGPNHVLKTYLAVDGDDLWLIGTGDPATGDPTIAKAYQRTTMSMLDDWAAALKKRGINRIRGRIWFYDGAFEETRVHPSWSKSFAGDWYAAPVAGLNFNDNCVDVKVLPTREGDKPRLSLIPPNRLTSVINNATSGGKGDVEIKRDLDENVFRISGSATQPTDLPSTSVIDPGAFFADALRTHLIWRGIPVDGGVERAEKPLGGKLEPPAGKIVAVHETRMSDVMWRINKNSQNLFAEAMCKMLGREWLKKQGKTAPGSWKAGGAAVREFLTKNGIDTTHFVIVDGSGLSRDNRVTVRLISDLLVAMDKHPYRDAFKASLSVAGKDGTLRSRLKDLPPGTFIGKTGYIGSVRSLSGYVKTRSGEERVISIIFNGFKGSVKPYEELQDEVVRTLVDWPNAPTATASATADK